jgi:hypothetical protein
MRGRIYARKESAMRRLEVHRGREERIEKWYLMGSREKGWNDSRDGKEGMAHAKRDNKHWHDSCLHLVSLLHSLGHWSNLRPILVIASGS